MSRALTLLLVLVLAVATAGCGSDESKDGDDRDSRATTTESDESTDDEADEADDADKRDEADEHGDAGHGGGPGDAPSQPIIQVTTPTPLSYVSGAFVLAGTAQVVEGDLRWAILDSSLEPMAQGRMTASCGAPCRGNFRARIPLRGVELGSWELHVWAPPVDDNDPPRMHDTMVPITVTDEPVESMPLPEPGA